MGLGHGLAHCGLGLGLAGLVCNTVLSHSRRIGYSKENLKIHTGVPSLPSLPYPPLPFSPPCLPLPLPRRNYRVHHFKRPHNYRRVVVVITCTVDSDGQRSER